MAREPLADDSLHIVHVRLRRLRDVPRRPVALGQYRIVDQTRQRLERRDPRLAAAQAERHPAVLRRPDLARASDVRSCPPRLDVRAEPASGATHVRHQHRLLHRQVDVDRTDPRRERGQRRERDLRSGVRVRGVARAPHRCTIGIAGAVQVPGGRHHAEIGRSPRRPRPGRAERRHAHPHGVGGGGRGGSRARRDHHVGVTVDKCRAQRGEDPCRHRGGLRPDQIGHGHAVHERT